MALALKPKVCVKATAGSNPAPSVKVLNEKESRN